ncbi:MAG: hypothetical protein UU47_C0027G0011 [candidate division TM6 bacterium GW2011_GWE2_41_16]|nr:MAG: hypothetical protein UU47_C0027G0011 [candidate division TM6 bacterium GW2011_GWE2_41_16]
MNRVTQIMVAIFMLSSFSVGAMQEQQPVSVPNQQQGHGAPHKCSGSPKCKARCLKCVEEGCWDDCCESYSEGCDDCCGKCAKTKSAKSCAECCNLTAKCCGLSAKCFCNNCCCCCNRDRGCCWYTDYSDATDHLGVPGIPYRRCCCSSLCCVTTGLLTVVGLGVSIPFIVLAAVSAFRGK